MGPGWDKVAATRYAWLANCDYPREMVQQMRRPFRDAVAAYQAARAALPALAVGN